jgi:thiosulfate dehydrogenase
MIVFHSKKFISKKSIVLFAVTVTIALSQACSNKGKPEAEETNKMFQAVDTTKIPDGPFGEMVRYGRQLMLNTAYHIGPEGKNGKFTKNKMNCTNCHQDAGTKVYSFNLMLSQDNYPQYRPREGKVLTLADRVNNCIERPHSGKPLPLDSKEMTAFLSYLKWINSQANKHKEVKGYENLELELLDRAADPAKGQLVYNKHCSRCHGENGEGKMLSSNISYEYPPLWGNFGYQPGSSMHRVVKQARWLKANMPHDQAVSYNPILTDEECFDVAAFVNDDRIHARPSPANFDYPKIGDKNLDYGKGPFVDTFSEAQHKFGPWKPIVQYWEAKGWKPKF